MSRKYTSRIAAVCHVSESEIVAYEDLMYGKSSTVLPIEINSVLEDTYWLTILFRLGIDTNLPFEYQGVTQHRNRLNQIVTCGRWYGVERSDKNLYCLKMDEPYGLCCIIKGYASWEEKPCQIA